MPGIFHHAGCCCGDPCEKCTGQQPSAVVTVTGACSDGCKSLAGTYEFYAFDDTSPDYCCYWWTNESQTRWLHIAYCKDVKRFCGDIIAYEDATRSFGVIGTCTTVEHPYAFVGWEVQSQDLNAPGVLISCTGGILIGTFDLLGSASPPPDDDDCTGCTAHVTLGG